MANTNNNKSLNVPILRFPGFTGEWETKLLGECVTIKSGISPNCLSENGNFLYYKVEQLNHCEKELGETPYFACTSERNVIPEQSIIFPKRGAAIMTNKVRSSYKKCVLDTNLMALIPNENINSDFLYYFILRYQLGKIADTMYILIQ